MKMNEKLQTKLKDERGDFSIKGLAMTVAVIILVGVGLGVISGKLQTWIPDIWEMFLEKIKGFTA